MDKQICNTIIALIYQINKEPLFMPSKNMKAVVNKLPLNMICYLHIIGNLFWTAQPILIKKSTCSFVSTPYSTN